MRRFVVVIITSAIALTASLAAAQTREFLDAPVVKEQIRVQWDAKNKKFTYAVDDEDAFRELKANTLFLTKSSVFVTYTKINPLQMTATANINAADDPAHGVIAKLLEALISVASTVSPAAATGGLPAAAATDVAPLIDTTEATACSTLVQLQLRAQQLDAVLFGDATTPAAIKKHVDSWVLKIDTGYGGRREGAAAISDGIGTIDLFTNDLQNVITRATTLLTEMETIAKGLGTPECVEATRNAYTMIHLANPRARVDQIKVIRAAAVKVKESLNTDFVTAGSQWIGDVNYKVSPEIRPTADKLQNVVLKAVKVTLRVDEVSGALAVVQEESGSIAFTLRRYSALYPEIGGGPVFGFIKRPKYGTSTNAAGQTIVARVKDDEVSINPSVLVNFACRCELGPFVTPMLQIGAVTSKDLPGILLGGGLRLFGFGKGDVALGGGVMLGWIKDLTELKVDDVIRGTKDIEADLKYSKKPKARPYVVIQYKF